MKNAPALLGLPLLIGLVGCGPSEAPQAEVDLAGEPASTLQREMIQDLEQVKEKYLSLAQAVPQDAYGWRPAEGVRSIGEVYMHIAAANIGIIAGSLNVAPPPEADPSWYDFQNAEAIDDKEVILEALAVSFDYLFDVISETTDDRLEEAVNLFGSDSTVRGALLLVETHCHEHLGQSIAYARTNGVTPPWSAGG